MTISSKHFIPAAWITRGSGMSTTSAWRGFTCIVSRLKKQCGKCAREFKDSPRITTCRIFTMKRSQLPGCTSLPLITNGPLRSSSLRTNRGSAKTCYFVSGLANCLIPGRQRRHGYHRIVEAYQPWSEARKTSQHERILAAGSQEIQTIDRRPRADQAPPRRCALFQGSRPRRAPRSASRKRRHISSKPVSGHCKSCHTD
jgi:hypothetical protein